MVFQEKVTRYTGGKRKRVNVMEPYNAVAVGLRIGALRKGRGLTQAQLSEKVEIAEKHLSALERGKYRPSAETLYLLAQEFSVSADYLLTGNLEQPLNACVEKFLSQAPRGQQETVWEFLRELTKEEKP